MRRFFRKPLNIVITLVLALVLTVFGTLGVRDLLDPLEGRMAPGVRIGGLELGGMTRIEAWKAVKAAEEKVIAQNPLTVIFPSRELTIDPKEAGFRISAWNALRDAYRAGREAGAEEDLPLSAYLEYEEAYLRGILESYKTQYDTNLTQPSWKVRGQVPNLATDAFDPKASGQTVELTLGLPEQRLNVEDALKQLLAGYDRGLLELLPCAIDVPCKTEPQAPDLDEIYNTTLISAKNDGIDLAAKSIQYGAYGYHFDRERAEETIGKAGWGETVSIPMEIFEPEIFGDGVYFRDVLGVCETKHTADENRNINLQLVCDFLDGVVIQPGEEFSYNQTVGERSPERGFMPATVFAGDRVAKDYGGGVCQGSTTLYNCLLLADMEVTERHGHGALVTYVPLGLDAAVNWLTNTDLQFVNNSHFPVKIQAELSDGYMKMKLLGTDEKDYYIQLEAKQTREGDYIFAGSYMLKFDKKTNEQISRDRIAFSTYDLTVTG